MRIKPSLKAVLRLALFGLACLAVPGLAAEARPWTKATTPPLVFENLEGRKVDLGGSTGRVKVINFWAVWCAPCREELPVLEAYAREMQPKGADLSLVNVGDSPRAMNTFFQRAAVKMPTLRDVDSAVLGGEWNLRNLPATAVLDRKGRLRWIVIGKLDDFAEPVRSKVAALLNEK